MRLLPKTLSLLALLTLAPLAHAQVYRCIGAHGEPVYSDRPCGTPAPASSLAGAARNDALAGVCAASPQALRDAIVGAFSSHDVNKLAGLILWQGADQASAVASLRTLSAWLEQPLAGIAIAYATGPPTVAAAPVAATSSGQAQSSPGFVAQAPTGFEISTGGVDGSKRDFGVIEIAGCWWLTPPS